jgi:hypothetical protein
VWRDRTGRLHTLRLVDARQLRAVEVAKSLPVSELSPNLGDGLRDQAAAV